MERRVNGKCNIGVDTGERVGKITRSLRYSCAPVLLPGATTPVSDAQQTLAWDANRTSAALPGLICEPELELDAARDRIQAESLSIATPLESWARHKTPFQREYGTEEESLPRGALLGRLPPRGCFRLRHRLHPLLPPGVVGAARPVAPHVR